MEKKIVVRKSIKRKINTIRGLQVMLDSDLAELYGVDTKAFNQAVKRNMERFPEKFMFQLTKEEFDFLRSQFVTSKVFRGGRRYLPYAFTEQGVAMLSAVLKSRTAIEVSIRIMDAFVEMRKFLKDNAQIFQRMDSAERKLLEHDEKFEEVFNAIQEKDLKPEKGIFYDGQIIDAYKFVSGLVRSADKSLILIDNYVDETTLMLLAKRKKGVKATIYTRKISGQLSLDVKKNNEQYPGVVVKEYTKAHDRFLIVDEREVYHFGASLKDLGKKCFAFSRFDDESFGLLAELKSM